MNANFLKRLVVFTFFSMSLFGSVGVSQAGDLYTPTQGSPERKALMDSLRVPVEADLHTPVVFKVDRLKVSGDWAFLLAVPQQPDGKKIDYRGTRYAEAIKAGAFDNGICALFQRKNGQWKVVQYVLGMTDVPWEDWPQKYGAPATIFH